MNETDRIVSVAEAELANTLRLIIEHLAGCQAPRSEPGTLTGECDQCKSLAVHRARCEEQVRLLAAEDADAEEVPLW